MPNGWMVRAGKGGYLISEFEKHNCVAIHWHEMGNISDITTREELTTRVAEIYQDDSSRKVGTSAGILYRFKSKIEIGDTVVSYNAKERTYLIGEVTGNYKYEKGNFADHDNVIPVKWVGKIQRNDFSHGSRKSLGCPMTVFSLKEKVMEEIYRLL